MIAEGQSSRFGAIQVHPSTLLFVCLCVPFSSLSKYESSIPQLHDQTDSIPTDNMHDVLNVIGYLVCSPSGVGPI